MFDRLKELLLKDRNWMRHNDILLGIGVIAVVAMLVIPIPTFLLDFFLGISIMIGILILLITMYVPRSYDFSVFPTLLLVSTVYRLALNVSSTRLILLEGQSFDGKLIRAFGNFVVGGNYVVGFIIFIILVAVQFIVITKGATRTAEVAARFTLDAMPGKQMSIDSDLSNGLITEDEARRRRKDLQREADFYGAMDGASKFVQGDVKVGILIAFVNIIAGFIIGMAIRGESFDVAIKTYTLLSIGDGLVTQIPSLMVTTATGIIVTRAISDEKSLSADIVKQFSIQPRALMMTAGALGLMAILPGFPAIQMLLIAGGLGGLGWVLQKNQSSEKAQEKAKAESASARDKKPESVMPLISVDPLEVEIGYSLIPLVDPDQGGTLLDRITNIRRMSAINMGLIVPPIRIRDNMELEPTQYSVLIKGVEVGSGKLQPGKLMAMDAGDVSEKIEGAEFIEPAFGLKAIWIDTEKRDTAERRGYTVVDSPTIIATHLTEVIKGHAAEILGRQEVQSLVDSIKQDYPAVIDDLITSKKLSVGGLQKVLQNLLRERVSIRNMITILETLANYADHTNDPNVLAEYVRMGLSRQICKEYADASSIMTVITVDPDIEALIRSAIHDDPVEGKVLGFDPDTHDAVLHALLTSYQTASKAGFTPIFLVSPHIRSVTYSLLEREVKGAVVLSYNEIVPTVKVNVVASAIMAA
jgi:flagellar biosynthesis protein FlhA